MTRHTILSVACLAAMSLTACNTTNRTLPAIRNSGEYAYEHNDVDRAFSDFKEYTEQAPGHAYGHLWLGKTYLKKDMPAHAREQFELAYTNDPENPEVIAGLCQAMYQDNHLDDLFRLLHQRTGQKPKASDFVLLGKYSLLAGDADGAQAALLTAAKLDKGRSIDSQLALADFYAAIGKDEDAIKRARMAYYLNPTSPRVLAKLAELNVVAKTGIGLVPTETE
ncbi:MAG: hypothetical protein H7210_12355 [Pyrinomonadaceae bacterium]|nr:hypothetical protein [Phycisphaerales bacterium]